MHLFAAYPHIEYFGRELVDTTIRVDIIDKIKNNVAVFEYTDIIDGERPEDLALLIYGDAGLYWLILYLNDKTHVDDWPKNYQQLLDYTEQKYGVNKVYSVHHYETTASSDLGAGVWVNQGTPFSVAVTNYDYETKLNEAKRRIKTVKLRYLEQILAEYTESLK